MQETLIGIITCPAYAEKIKAQQDVWISKFVAAGWHVEIFGGARLGVPDDYASLPLKTKALCKWALTHGYKRLLKLDDDAWLCLSRFAVSHSDYAGVMCSANDLGNAKMKMPPLRCGETKFVYASGGAYWMSARSMQIVADTEPRDWAEDRGVGQVLGRAGIKLEVLPNSDVVGYIKSALPAVVTQCVDVRTVARTYGPQS